jgi:transcriptional regulator with XRE-family HTH domain
MTRTTLGRQLAPVAKAARQALGWSQRELADRLGISQAWICRIEAGTAHGVTLRVLDQALDELGVRVAVLPEGAGTSERRLQRDPAHALATAYIARHLERAGWQVRTEVEVGTGRFRGWIDVLAWHEASRTLLVVEMKTELRDLGAAERQLGWYEREAWRFAAREWTTPARLRSGLVLLATEHNDATVRLLREPLDRWLPRGATDFAGLVTDPAGDSGGRCLAMVDPLSRRQDWLIRTRRDGRRSPLPDADYRAFMTRRRRRAG